MTAENRDYASELKALFPAAEVTAGPARRFWISIAAEELRAAVQALSEKLGIRHLTTIVGEDLREGFLVSYVMSGAVVVVLQVKVSRAQPEVPSLAPLIAGAMVYEREIHDLFGIVAKGNPDLRRQVLPEDWPDGVYPLRKDAVLPAAKMPAEEGNDA